MVTPAFRPIHGTMRETIEELLSTLSHGYSPILAAALRIFLRIASRVNLNWEISSSAPKRVLKVRLNDFSDVILIDLIQVGHEVIVCWK